MRIALYGADGPIALWVEGFRALLPQAEVVQWTPGGGLADYAVVWAPPQAFFDDQPQLKVVFNNGAGVDALLKLRIPPDTQVVRLDDAGMAVQMADFVCHAVIRHFRGFDAYDEDTRDGIWEQRKAPARAQFPVGILGLGVLGTRVAQALRVFDFPVNGWSRQAKVLDGVQCFAGPDGLDAFLAASKALVCLLPLTRETQGILNRHTLSRLQPGGYVVNVGRGAHLVDADLLALLGSGHLAGAALDVFRNEPLPDAHPFWLHPKITITPHISARTLRADSIAQIVGKIQALQQGQPVTGVVDRSQGY